MATKTDEGIRGCNFQWEIKNISHCWLKRDECINSPQFIADALEGTKWMLRVFPSGNAFTKDFVSFYLHRTKDSGRPTQLEVNSEIAIIDKDGAVLKEMTSTKSNFLKDSWHLTSHYELIKKVFDTHRETFLPADTLTVKCAIWDTDVKPNKLQQLFARTVFKVERRNFIWRIDNFSALQSGFKNRIKDGLIEFDLVFNEGLDFEKKLQLNINSFDDSIKYFSLKISTVNCEEKTENCGAHEYFAEDLKKGVLGTQLITRLLMKSDLANDVLSLDCEYAYSDGTVSYEQSGCGVISPKLKNEVIEARNMPNIEEKETVLVNDLKFMYNDAICSDMEIRTPTQTFPAHRAVLSARSPVFRSMFSNDMKEKCSGHVDVTDLEDDTIHRMLLYIYTDSLENVQFESALKLYVAADKYQISSLKSKSCSFLKDNLSTSKACEVLILADQHQDSDLICFAQDFILKNYRDVLDSMEWKDFMNTHLKLAADVMYRFAQSKMKDP